jgi:hypothetical protein
LFVTKLVFFLRFIEQKSQYLNIIVGTFVIEINTDEYRDCMLPHLWR